MYFYSLVEKSREGKVGTAPQTGFLGGKSKCEKEVEEEPNIPIVVYKNPIATEMQICGKQDPEARSMRGREGGRWWGKLKRGKRALQGSRRKRGQNYFPKQSEMMGEKRGRRESGR